MNASGGSSRISGRYVTALKKVNGAWKLFLDADNSPTPVVPAGPAPKK